MSIFIYCHILITVNLNDLEFALGARLDAYLFGLMAISISDFI